MIEATCVDHLGSDLSVVNSARVSFGKESDWEYDLCDCDLDAKDRCELCICEDGAYLREEDKRLIQYLAKHKHTSPFGHAFASFHVKAPLFVARQLVKHKFLRWNEISRRYVDNDPEFFEPDMWRGKSEDKKQGSSGEVDIHLDWDDSCYIPSNLNAESLATYQHLLASGVCPEQARMVLPQSMITEWYWSGSLDAFADMCNLRLKPDTQAETRVVAQQIDETMRGLFPVSWEALIESE